MQPRILIINNVSLPCIMSLARDSVCNVLYCDHILYIYNYNHIHDSYYYCGRNGLIFMCLRDNAKMSLSYILVCYVWLYKYWNTTCIAIYKFQLVRLNMELYNINGVYVHDTSEITNLCAADSTVNYTQCI